MENEEIDTLLFIEIVQTEGVRLLWLEEDYLPDINYVFQGLNGKKVIINASDEYLSKQTARMYLIRLGLASLIERGLI